MSKKVEEIEEIIDPLTEDTNNTGDTDIAPWDEESENKVLSLRNKSAPLEPSDFIIPSLNIAQKSGDLGEHFPKGAWVLNKELALTKGVGEPLSVIVLTPPVKFYMEHLPYDPAGPKPRFFDELEDVQAAGLTVEWDNINNLRPTADRAARITLLIANPGDLESDSSFNMPIEEFADCAIASWLVVNTAYRNVARRLFTAEKLELSDKPFYAMKWTIMAVNTTSGGYSFIAPRITPAGWNSEKTIKSVQNCLKNLSGQ